VTLIVGQEKARINCHKALLAFYSTLFESALYGGFRESHDNEVILPEETEQGMTSFVTWLYTGILEHDDKEPACDAWVLGDKLGAPGFTNEAMYKMCNFYANETLQTSTLKYVYSYTAPGSKLRRFIVDCIKYCGPFLRQAKELRYTNTVECYHKQWEELLAEGRDLVREIVKHGFRTYAKRKFPWLEVNIPKYLEPEGLPLQCLAEKWRKEKMEIDIQRQKGWEKRHEAEKVNLRRSWAIMASTDLILVDSSDSSRRLLRAETAPL
jgi:hypothetical protein